MSDAERLARVMDLIDDPSGLRVLDLACRTGLFAQALAKAGADVLGIEGRQENLELAEPGPARLQLGDVRTLPPRLGQFDVVLCLGILYHLGAVDVLSLLLRLRSMTDRVIVDTHVSDRGGCTVVDGHEFAGHSYLEPDGLWSSLDLAPSWWFTPESLHDVFRLTGWTAMPVPGPAYPGEPADRRWYVLEAS